MNPEKEGTNLGLEFPKVVVRINGVETEIIPDTGSDCNAMGEEVYDRLIAACGKREVPRLPVRGIVVKGIIQSKSWQIKHQLVVEIEIGTNKFPTTFYLIPGNKVIIGVPSLKEMRAVLDAGRERIYFFDEENTVDPHKQLIDTTGLLNRKGEHQINILNQSLDEVVWREKVDAISKIGRSQIERSRSRKFILFNRCMKNLNLFIDGFTRYTHLIPIKNATIQNMVAKIKKDYIHNVGPPKYIITDGSTQFGSSVWDQKLARLGITATKTTSYNPSGNLAERQIREVVVLLRLYCHRKQRSWSSRLVEINEVINQHHHSSIGMTPFEAQLGYKPPDVLQEWINFPNNPTKTQLQYREIVRRLRKKLSITHKTRRRKHNRTHRITILTPGSLVLLRNTQRTDHSSNVMRKLTLIFTGPYRVKRQIYINVYSLEDLVGNPIGNFNIKRMKLYTNVSDSSVLAGRRPSNTRSPPGC